MVGKYSQLSAESNGDRKFKWRPTHIAVLLLAILLAALRWVTSKPIAPAEAPQILHECRYLRAKPGPPLDFHKRTVSDRFEPGTAPVLIRNATIWTGGHYGTEVVFGDLLMDGGLIKAVGYIPHHIVAQYSPALLPSVNVHGAWVTPGIFDLHSHIGLMPAPVLTGALDLASPHGPVHPWMRSLEGFNTRDLAFERTVAGGVIGGLILPGSGNAIGGQAFPVKYRKTPDRSPESMVIEPPFILNGSFSWDPSRPLRWRHMKHATGENQLRYGSRMDSTWAFRNAYEKARLIKDSQDSYCAKAEAGLWDDPEVKGKKFPYDLQWEALVDVLRGRVKVNCHTYETTDISFLKRLTNEFKFPIAAIHHAHEAYLAVGDLKKMWKGPPAVATFALNARYKRESYRGSEFAGRILADNDITVIMKSDHDVLDSRYLLFEAQQAHFYSLQTNLAMRSVMTAPAETAGLGHRLGSLSVGYDADVVIWDSHPLVLGSTPKQVYIDGIPQLKDPQLLSNKGSPFQNPPLTPNWDREIEATLKYDGLPPLRPTEKLRDVVFFNVKELWLRDHNRVYNALGTNADTAAAISQVVISGGRITCVGTQQCDLGNFSPQKTIDLKGGSISIGLTSYGSPLGLSEISAEPSTSDGARINPLLSPIRSVLEDATAIDAIDGLAFEGRDTLHAYRFGVTSAISSPDFSTPGADTFQGTSVAFRTGATHALEPGAILKDRAALHLAIHPTFGRNTRDPGVSTQISAIRSALLGEGNNRASLLFQRAASGEIPLVIEADSADVMAALIRLKHEVENIKGNTIKMTFSGASEAHLLADELARENISIILYPVRPYPGRWEQRRALAGPPLTKDTVLTSLLAKNITVGVGVVENWEVRNAMLNIAWAALDADFTISRGQAIALATTNLFDIFDISEETEYDELVVYQGDMFTLESRVVAIVNQKGGFVDIL